ncbi:hypothetical protein CBL_00084 [Carabus blaptoides fortunei]
MKPVRREGPCALMRKDAWQRTEWGCLKPVLWYKPSSSSVRNVVVVRRRYRRRQLGRRSHRGRTSRTLHQKRSYSHSTLFVYDRETSTKSVTVSDNKNGFKIQVNTTAE